MLQPTPREQLADLLSQAEAVVWAYWADIAALKGERAGHPFRGNQWTGGRGGAALSKEDELAVHNYSGDFFSDINNHLRNGKNINPLEKDTEEKITKILNGSKTSEPITVYRGAEFYKMGNSDAIDIREASFHIGGEFTDKSFVSTSEKIDVAGGFSGLVAPVVFTVNIPAGSHALSLEKLSSRPYEKEVLLQKNSRFKIINIRKDGDDITDIWHVEVEAVTSDQ